MRLFSLVSLALAFSAAASVQAQADPRLQAGRMTQLEAGINWYDLNQRNLWPEDHPDMAMVCAAATGAMALKMEDTATTDKARASGETLKVIARSWLTESALRRGMEREASNEKYFTPALGMMTRIDYDTLAFWTEHCLELTRKSLPAQ